MLNLRISEINAELLAQICSEQWGETQTLDFKAILPKATDEDRMEFRKDVCALANADGGDIVFGISEKAGRANSVNPITGTTFDATKRSLLQLLESRIEPSIPAVRFHEVQVEGGFVLLLRVPASFVGPHRFGAPAAERFVMRTDTKTIDLSYVPPASFRTGKLARGASPHVSGEPTGATTRAKDRSVLVLWSSLGSTHHSSFGPCRTSRRGHCGSAQRQQTPHG